MLEELHIFLFKEKGRGEQKQMDIPHAEDGTVMSSIYFQTPSSNEGEKCRPTEETMGASTVAQTQILQAEMPQVRRKKKKKETNFSLKCFSTLPVFYNACFQIYQFFVTSTCFQIIRARAHVLFKRKFIMSVCLGGTLSVCHTQQDVCNN